MNTLASGGPEKREKYIYGRNSVGSRIADLGIILSQIYEKEYTYNPYKNYIKKIAVQRLNCSEEDIRLYYLLVHGITLVHRNNRLKEKGIYRTEKADLMIALDIMGIVIIPFQETTKTNTEYYHALYKEFGHRLFKRKEAQVYLGLKKTHTCRVLNGLVKHKLLKRYGHKNRGYRYVIVLPDEES